MRPTVTLLITTHNRASLLEESLGQLAELTPPDELIVVDDGGTDHTRTVVMNAPGDYERRYIYNNNPGWTSNCLARNIGIRAAHGEEILVTEPELVFITDVIPQMLDARRELPDKILHGATYRGQEGVPHPEYAHLEVQIPYFTLYKREWLLAVRGYDEGFEDPYAWDDVDLNQRLGQSPGRLLVLVLQARGFHQWHPSRNMAADRNEARVRAKVWPDDIVANTGREWGVRL